MIDTYGWVAQLRTSRGLMRFPLPPVTLKRRGKILRAYAYPDCPDVSFHIPDTRTVTGFEVRIPFAGGHNVVLDVPGLPVTLTRGEIVTVYLPRPMLVLEGAV